ncbi:hypothetical protein I4U23_023426 [Adineta vaga]|nr:hypothetical protein I4U23_023426 [Adineta vaga]
MKRITLFTCFLFLLFVHISYNQLVNSINDLDIKYSNSSKFDYNPCNNKSRFNHHNGTISYCQLNHHPLLIKESRKKPSVSVTTSRNINISTTTKVPRCGVIDGPLLYSLETQWGKKDFTWKLINSYLPSFGAGRTRAILYESFNDWARYAPLTFREVSEHDKADFEISFIHRYHDPIRRFDGPGGTLAYAYLPPSGIVHFEAEEDWTEEYTKTGFNLRLVATHEIGHALGLGHSEDPKSIMFERYQLFQPSQLLPKDDQLGIQGLYQRRSSSARPNRPTIRQTTARTTIRYRPPPPPPRSTTTTRRTTIYRPTTTTTRRTTKYRPATTRRVVTYKPTTTPSRTNTYRPAVTPPNRFTYRMNFTWRTSWYQPTTPSWSTRRHRPPWRTRRRRPRPTKKMRTRRPFTKRRRTEHRQPNIWRTRRYTPVTVRTSAPRKKTTVRIARHTLTNRPQTRYTIPRRVPIATTTRSVRYRTTMYPTTRKQIMILSTRKRRTSTELPEVLVRLSVWPIRNIRLTTQPTRKLTKLIDRVRQITGSTKASTETKRIITTSTLLQTTKKLTSSSITKTTVPSFRSSTTVAKTTGKTPTTTPPIRTTKEIGKMTSIQATTKSTTRAMSQGKPITNATITTTVTNKVREAAITGAKGLSQATTSTSGTKAVTKTTLRNATSILITTAKSTIKTMSQGETVTNALNTTTATITNKLMGTTKTDVKRLSQITTLKGKTITTTTTVITATTTNKIMLPTTTPSSNASVSNQKNSKQSVNGKISVNENIIRERTTSITNSTISNNQNQTL